MAKRKPKLVVRHYCQGIGDSHLLRFEKNDGTSFFMLIDCGLHTSVSGATATMDRVVADIAGATDGHLDVLVVTHEHWDHVSAFLTAADAFKNLRIDDVWMGWTENGADPAVRDLDKFKSLAANVTGEVATSLAGANWGVAAAVHQGISSLSGFQFSLKGERVRKARDAAKDLARDDLRYLDPTTKPFALPGVPGIRVYVLGPPRDETLLRLTTRQSEMYQLSLARGLNMGQALSAAPSIGGQSGVVDVYAPFDFEEGQPFDRMLMTGEGTPPPEGVGDFLKQHYLAPDSAGRDQKWRRIDDDWMYAAADLALQFDSRTNNTSLVLAFEFVDTGRVALFAADAQVGNWLSWQDLAWTIGGETITGPDLLSRVVYLKVAHHGSENATLEAKGLELMESPDLAAFIPVNEDDAKKVGWGRMPFGRIRDRLLEKTSARVIRSDDTWIADGKPPSKRLVSGSIVSLSHEPDLYVEIGVA